jgi:dynein heavy chain
METDWWAASQRLLNNPKLLSELVEFNHDSLTDKAIDLLGKFINDPAIAPLLQLETVSHTSKACECLIKWVRGVYNFYFVNKKVKPKKQAL